MKAVASSEEKSDTITKTPAEDEHSPFLPENTQIEPNTVVSTAVSSLETRDSIITSIPSEAPTRDIPSVGSDSILPLIEETFENSITGHRGGDAAKEQPFRKHARCSARNHFDAPCSECDSIENNIRQEDNASPKKQATLDVKAKVNKSDEKLHLLAIKPINHSTSNENVWQVTDTEKYDTTGKFMISPLTVCSSQGASTLTSNSALKFGVDNTSFIILHDENENASHFLPNITNDSDQSGIRNENYPSKIGQNTFERPCDDCCFCNPTLHHKRRNGKEQSPKRCNFCSSRQQSTQTTPATSTRCQEKSQIENGDAETTARTSAPMERIYESKFRSNHTHIRTHSRESDTINTQCTKKTNKKVRKTLLNSSDDRLNANHETTTRNNPEESNVNEINGNRSTKQKSSIPKLPPAIDNNWIMNSMDSATSPTSSNSTGSSTKSHRRQDSKSVPNLPRPEPRQNTETSPNSRPQKTRMNSRYQNFYGNGSGSAEQVAVTSSESKPKSKPTGKLI